MKLKISQAVRRRDLAGWLSTGIAATVAAVMVALVPTSAQAIATPVPLGTAASFSVLAGSEVTNTGPSVLSQDLGVSPGTAISGFPPGQVLGAVHAADQVANNAKSDLVTAYNNAASQATDFALARESVTVTPCFRASTPLCPVSDSPVIWSWTPVGIRTPSGCSRFPKP